MVILHVSPLVEEVYVFSPGCSYDQRSEPLCVMDAIYTHEGERVYISGLRGKFNREIAREVIQLMARKGVVQIEFEHRGRQRVVSLK